MLPLLILLPLCLPSTQAAKTAQETSVEVTLDQLDQALIAQDSGEIIRLLGTVHGVGNGRITAAAGEALRHPDVGVRGAGVEALRHAESPQALELLHAFFGQRKTLQANAGLLAQLLQATAQHGQISSLTHLIRGGFTNDTDQVLRARILGLGNLHAKGSLDRLMKGLAQVSPDQRLLHMDEFRLALVRLSGKDWGMDSGAWLTWWEKAKPKHRTPEAKLPAALQPEWDAYWTGSLLQSVLDGAAKPQTAKPKQNRARRAKNQKKQAAGARSQAIEANSKKDKAPSKAAPVTDDGAGEMTKPMTEPKAESKPAGKGGAIGKKAGKAAPKNGGKGKKGKGKKKAKPSTDTAGASEPAKQDS